MLTDHLYPRHMVNKDVDNHETAEFCSRSWNEMVGSELYMFASSSTVDAIRRCSRFEHELDSIFTEQTQHIYHKPSSKQPGNVRTQLIRLLTHHVSQSAQVLRLPMPEPGMYGKL